MCAAHLVTVQSSPKPARATLGSIDPAMATAAQAYTPENPFLAHQGHVPHPQELLYYQQGY